MYASCEYTLCKKKKNKILIELGQLPSFNRLFSASKKSPYN